MRSFLQLVKKKVSGWVLETAITTNAPKGDSFKVVNQVCAVFVMAHSVRWCNELHVALCSIRSGVCTTPFHLIGRGWYMRLKGSCVLQKVWVIA